MAYYSAIKKNTFESVLMRWMKLEPLNNLKCTVPNCHLYALCCAADLQNLFLFYNYNFMPIEYLISLSSHLLETTILLSSSVSLNISFNSWHTQPERLYSPERTSAPGSRIQAQLRVFTYSLK